MPWRQSKTKLLATTIFPVVHGGTFLLAGWCWSLVPWLQGMATDGIEGGVGYLVPFFSQTRSRTFRYTWNLNFKWSVVRIRFYPQVEGQHWNIYIYMGHFGSRQIIDFEPSGLQKIPLARWIGSMAGKSTRSVDSCPRLLSSSLRVPKCPTGRGYVVWTSKLFLRKATNF